jgi:hypothetical protein
MRSQIHRVNPEKKGDKDIRFMPRKIKGVVIRNAAGGGQPQCIIGKQVIIEKVVFLHI